jgi:hypothetical protein
MEILAVASASSENHLPKLLARVAGEIEPSTEVVLVSTRPVDPSEVSEGAASGDGSSRRLHAGRVRCVNTSSNQLTEFFHP